MDFALTPDSRWETDLAGLITATADAGFSSLAIPANQAGPEAAAAYKAAGLRCDEVLALVLSADEEKSLASAARLAETASGMGAAWVLTVFNVKPDPAYAARIAAVIAEGGARMAVEFSPLGPVSSIPIGLEIVEAAGPGKAGLMIDSWHFSRGPSTWEDLETVPLDRIAYLQFTDALAPGDQSLVAECMHGRAVPGDGVLDLHRFASTLRGRGWDGLVSVEVLSAALRSVPVPEAVRRLYERTASYWT